MLFQLHPINCIDDGTGSDGAFRPTTYMYMNPMRSSILQSFIPPSLTSGDLTLLYDIRPKARPIPRFESLSCSGEERDNVVVFHAAGKRMLLTRFHPRGATCDIAVGGSNKSSLRKIVGS